MLSRKAHQAWPASEAARRPNRGPTELCGFASGTVHQFLFLNKKITSHESTNISYPKKPAIFFVPHVCYLCFSHGTHRGRGWDGGRSEQTFPTSVQPRKSIWYNG